MRTRPGHTTQPQSCSGTRLRGGQGLDTEPSYRVDRVEGRGHEKDNRRARPGHRAPPQSPTTELTEFRGAAKRRPRGGQGPATELTEFRGAEDKRRTRPSHRAQPQSSGARSRGGQGPATEPSHRVDRVQGRGQEEDKAQPQSPATDFRGAASECGQLFSFYHRTPTVNCLGKLYFLWVYIFTSISISISIHLKHKV